MAAKTKITREMILNQAFKIVQDKGYHALSARSIAQGLACSTQPVLYHFATMEAIKEATYQLVNDYHTRYLLDIPPSSANPLLTLGLNYLQFSLEEQHFFIFLFQTNHFSQSSLQDILEDPNLNQILEVMGQSLNWDLDRTQQSFASFFFLVHGVASLLANNAMKPNLAELETILENFYQQINKE